MSIEQMRQRVQAFTDKECGLGATKDDIDRAQDKLGATFPESYQCFLRDFGWARFSHEELYGLGNDVPKHLDLIRNTLSERHQMLPQLPVTLIPIMSDGAGNHYCLSLSGSQECPVVFWNHELGHGQHLETIAPAFAQWLVAFLDQLTA